MIHQATHITIPARKPDEKENGECEGLVEHVATVQCINGVTIGYLEVRLPVGTKLYTRPIKIN